MARLEQWATPGAVGAGVVLAHVVLVFGLAGLLAAAVLAVVGGGLLWSGPGAGLGGVRRTVTSRA